MFQSRIRGALSDITWQDREIYFDMDQRQMKLIPGEHIVDKIEGVEDTKGNNGDRGTMRITNLRLIWHSNMMPRINLSIGLNTITGVTTRIAKSKLRGASESLFLMAKNQSTRFEFVFTCVNNSSTVQNKLFTTVIGLHRAYETSKLYRDMKMRGALIDDDERLRILPLEQICDKFEGVWNLSSEQTHMQGNLGIFIMTNVRIVWYAALNFSHNVSIPYLQLRSCRIRDSRFGHALVLETSVQSGEFMLGFSAVSEERLDMICKTMVALHTAFLAAPIFGVQHQKEYVRTETDEPERLQQDEDFEDSDFPSKEPTRVDAFAAYFSDGVENPEKRPPVYSSELGVSIEQLKTGFSVNDLWFINSD